MVRPLLVVAIVAVVITGCAITSRPVRPMQLANHATALLRDGTAMIPGEDGNAIKVSADQVVSVRIRDPGGAERPVKLTLRTLVEGCSDDATAPGCLAYRAVDDPIMTKKKVRFDGNKLAPVIAVAMLATGIGVCAAECEDPDKELRNAGLIGGGVVIGLVAMMTLLSMGID